MSTKKTLVGTNIFMCIVWEVFCQIKEAVQHKRKLYIKKAYRCDCMKNQNSYHTLLMEHRLCTVAYILHYFSLTFHTVLCKMTVFTLFSFFFYIYLYIFIYKKMYISSNQTDWISQIQNPVVISNHLSIFFFTHYRHGMNVFNPTCIES